MTLSAAGLVLQRFNVSLQFTLLVQKYLELSLKGNTVNGIGTFAYGNFHKHANIHAKRHRLEGVPCNYLSLQEGHYCPLFKHCRSACSICEMSPRGFRWIIIEESAYSSVCALHAISKHSRVEACQSQWNYFTSDQRTSDSSLCLIFFTFSIFKICNFNFILLFSTNP